jgi:hypothetical protein
MKTPFGIISYLLSDIIPLIDAADLTMLATADIVP